MGVPSDVSKRTSCREIALQLPVSTPSSSLVSRSCSPHLYSTSNSLCDSDSARRTPSRPPPPRPTSPRRRQHTSSFRNRGRSVSLTCGSEYRTTEGARRATARLEYAYLRPEDQLSHVLSSVRIVILCRCGRVVASGLRDDAYASCKSARATARRTGLVLETSCNCFASWN